MSFLDIFRPQKVKKAEVKEKIIDSNPDPQWTTLSIGSLGLEAKSATLLQEYMGWVYANVSAISEGVADIDFELYKVKKNGDLDEVEEHPILELLHRPNQSMTKREFINLLQTYRLLTGESPIRIRKQKGGLPYELWPIDPLNLTPIIGKTSDGFEMVVKYELSDYTNGILKVIDLKPDEVIFIKNINPRSIWRGFGVVEAAQNSIDTLHYSELYNLNFFKNSAVPFTVLYTDQKLTEQTLARLKNTWSSSYQGVNNSFKTAVLEAGLKVEKLQQSSKDMDFIEQQRFLRDKLMAMFKTTKIALGITEDVNRANAEASEYVFMKNCIRPKMAQFIDSFNEFLVPLLDQTGTLFLDFTDPVPRDRVVQVSEYSSAVDKWMTKNEIRDEEGLPPLEGGDEIWQALNLTTMSNPTPNTPDIQTTPKPTEDQPDQGEEEPAEKPEEVEEEKSYRVLKVKSGYKKKLSKDMREKVVALKNRNIRLKQMKEELKKELRKILKSKVKIQPAIKYTKPEPKYKDMQSKRDIELYLKSLQGNETSFEKKLNDTMQWKYYQPQMEYILRQLNKGTKFILTKSIKKIEKAVGDEFMWDEDQYIGTGIDLLTPLLKDLVMVQGGEALLTVNTDMSYSLLREAQKYLKKRPTEAIKSVTNTAYERIRNSLAEGIKAGESIIQLKDRVIEGYKSLEQYQAEVIARTEVKKATTFATVDAFKQSGVVEGKEWVMDGRPCEVCQALDGEIVGLDESFSDGSFGPGDPHPNCMCELKSVEKIVEKKVEPKKKTIEEVLDEIDMKIVDETIKEVEDENGQ